MTLVYFMTSRPVTTVLISCLRQKTEHTHGMVLRPRGHKFALPTLKSEFARKSYVNRSLVHVYITILSSVLHRILYLIYCIAVLLYLLIVLYVLLELLLRATAFENKHDTYLLTYA